MKIIKKILFPFYTKKYEFLQHKKWFRLLVSFYIFLILILLISILTYSNYLELRGCEIRRLNNTFYCFLVKSFYDKTAILYSIILFYSLQLIFFKWFINYILLNNNKKNEKTLS